MKPSLAVVGSINADLVVRMPRLPGRGESVEGGPPVWLPGGKGANQAIAASRLGADVWMYGAVGQDEYGELCLAALRHDRVDVAGVRKVAGPTSMAVVMVEEPTGENQIVVAQGANQHLCIEPRDWPRVDAVLCQLEVLDAPLLAAATACQGLFCLNAAPARTLPAALLPRIDVLILNEPEYAWYGQPAQGMVVVTAGAHEAIIYLDGAPVAWSQPPKVAAIDTVGAGDTFSAALVVALAEGRDYQSALDWACAAASLSTLAVGAQAGMPTAAAVYQFMSRNRS